MLSRLIYGSRVSLLVGATSVVIAGVVGVVLGLLSGYYGGRVDSVISWLANVQLSFPFILLVIALVAVVGAGLMNVIIVLGFASWVIYQRVVRGEVLAIREREFIEAARVLGARDGRILVRHILPNLLTPLIVIATLQVAQMIIAESALSFLGLGVQPGIPSWGSMLADGRNYLTVAWWVATLPGLAIVVTVLAINVLGDWLRDELDPRLRT
jgi:peptide/nickel transport system permease protein